MLSPVEAFRPAAAALEAGMQLAAAMPISRVVRTAENH